ncbi:MAG TPA: porin family protein [bacterium]|jgi:hypothetical protein
MKKLPISVLLLAGLFAFHSNSYALLRLGVKAGVNFSSITVSNPAPNTVSVTYKRTPGVMLGASAEVAVAPALSIRTELLFVDRSTKFDAKNSNGTVTASGTLRLNETSLAPFLVIRYPTPGGVIPFLQVGPEFGLRTFLSKKNGGIGETVDQAWKKSNFSMNAGAGIILPVGPAMDLTLDGRYNFSLINLHSGGSTKTHTNGIQFLAGWNFLKI